MAWSGSRSRKPLTRSSWLALLTGADERVLVVRQADPGRLGLLGEGRDEVVVDPRAGEHPGGGRAVLAGVEVARDRDGLGGGLDVGVVEDDDRRLAAELEVDALEVLGGATPPPACPARTEPVIATIAASGARPGARPVSRSPVMTLRTPGGRNSAAISASSSVVSGVVSLGLSTTVLPAARAGANFQMAIIIG